MTLILSSSSCITINPSSPQLTPEPEPAPAAELAAPQLIYPKNGARDVNSCVIFAWRTAPNADTYTVEMSKYPEVSHDLLGTGYLYSDTGYLRLDEVAFFCLRDDLPNATQYYWRVTAISKDGKRAYSDIWTFVTCNPLPAPAPE